MPTKPHDIITRETVPTPHTGGNEDDVLCSLRDLSVSTRNFPKADGFSPGELAWLVSSVLPVADCATLAGAGPKLRLFRLFDDTACLVATTRPILARRALRGGRQRHTMAADNSPIDHSAGFTFQYVKSAWILRNCRRKTEMATMLQGKLSDSH